MSEPASALQVALEYHKALRAEILERLKMRDRILLGYLAASAALIGYGVEHEAFKPPTAFILPFLALGAAITITQHQDQIVTFNQYITLELADHLPSHTDRVINFNESEAAREHTSHHISMNLAAQLILLCGPPIFTILVNLPYSANHWSLKESYATIGFVLTILTAARLWISRNFRSRVMFALFAKAPKKRHHT